MLIDYDVTPRWAYGIIDKIKSDTGKVLLDEDE